MGEVMPEKKHCLVVDDNYDLFVITQAGLAERYECDYAPDAFTAQQFLGHKHYDVLLCDIKMPHLDGFGLVEELRKKTINLPIIFISGLIDPESVRRAFQLGAANVIAKPVSIDELLEKVERAVKMRESIVTETYGSEQEMGHVYNLLKSHYYDIQEILYQIQLHRIPLKVIKEELDKKERIGKCYLDDPGTIKLLAKVA
jgi:DNA-binding NtrC family response regulator